MRKIIFIIAILLIAVSSVTWLYFKNLSPESNGSSKMLNMIPDDAALVFEYKNEDSFYQIFKEFTLFKGLIGENSFDRLKDLKDVFITDPQIASCLDKSNLYFSLHTIAANHADFLMAAALSPLFTKDNSPSDLIKKLGDKYALKSTSYNKQEVFNIKLKKDVSYNFIIYKSVLIGSFDISLLKRAIVYMDEKSKMSSNIYDTETPRNKNAIANLFINFSKLPDFLNSFSRYKNPPNTSCLKNFKAFASLNINFQSDAFMFSGITIPDTVETQYANLFLHQEPGKLTLNTMFPIDVASYCTFYVSNPQKFRQDLHQQFKQQNTFVKIRNQIKTISNKHSINLEEGLSNIFGNEFGIAELASGEKLGFIKTVNAQRLTFLLSIISTEVEPNIHHFDDENIMYFFVGEPFKNFGKSYFSVVNNYLIISTSASALKGYMQNYQQQKLLNLNEKYLQFQQYLSNQGNIFYVFHNRNSKSIIKRFLSVDAYRAFDSKDFQYQKIYGLSIQFSADKNKFYTNLYMNVPENQINSSELTDSVYIDSLNRK
jgi:hypothetical protein